MTRDEAIAVFECLAIEMTAILAGIPKSEATADQIKRYIDAYDMAISALRQQDVTGKDVGRNAPLTLDELRYIPCEPVYIVAGHVSWWDIVSFAGMEYLYLKVEGSLPLRDYGKNWTAYRQKPEEDDHEM